MLFLPMMRPVQTREAHHRDVLGHAKVDSRKHEEPRRLPRHSRSKLRWASRSFDQSRLQASSPARGPIWAIGRTRSHCQNDGGGRRAARGAVAAWARSCERRAGKQPSVPERSNRLDRESHPVHVVCRNLMKNRRIQLAIHQHKRKAAFAKVKPRTFQLGFLAIEGGRRDDASNSDLDHLTDAGGFQVQVVRAVRTTVNCAARAAASIPADSLPRRTHWCYRAP